ncbi:MAG: hypothetical protein IJC46_01725 [Clostridia bacterium]|nr:hypothetical protein [Clostridia bacterium]
MKKRFFILALILSMVLLSMTACNEEMDENDFGDIFVTGYKPILTAEMLIEGSDLIIRGRVISKDGEAMNNPNNDRVSSDGVILNALITSYTVEIDEVYKGYVAGETICVKTIYGAGYPASMLVGEDGKLTSETQERRKELSTEGDCILMLTYNQTEAEVDTGYFPTREVGYLQPDGSGYYTNGDKISPISLTPEDIPEKLEAIKNRKNEVYY